MRPSIDAVGAKVNGRYLPNGAYERRSYTMRAFQYLRRLILQVLLLLLLQQTQAYLHTALAV